MTGRELCKKHNIKLERIADLACRLKLVAWMTKKGAYTYEFSDAQANLIIAAAKEEE